MRHIRDEELVRIVMADKSATPRERELALRVFKLIRACDDAEDTLIEILEGDHGTDMGTHTARSRSIQ